MTHLATFHERRLLMRTPAMAAEIAAELQALDGMPHSRACGIREHQHGPLCHPNCPSCSGGRTV